MTDQTTPGIGDNVQNIDFAAVESERLRWDYAYLETAVEDLFKEADAFDGVEDEESKAKAMNLIKRLRDEQKRILGVHELEKLPHYRRGQATDQFFFRLADKLARRSKVGPDGQADRLNRMLTAYDTRKLAEEMERRRREREEADRIAREADEIRRRAERAAEEARLQAERARVAIHKQTKTEAAQQAAQAESEAIVAAEIAAAKAEEARIATLVTPADVMRTRTENGTLGTMGTESFAEITDYKNLDLETLRPYFTQPAVLAALNGYARAMGYSADASVQIKGAVFGKRAKSRVR